MKNVITKLKDSNEEYFNKLLIDSVGIGSSLGLVSSVGIIESK